MNQSMSEYARMIQSGITFMMNEIKTPVEILSDEELVTLHYAMLTLGAVGETVQGVWQELDKRDIKYSTKISINIYKEGKLLPGGPLCLNQ